MTSSKNLNDFTNELRRASKTVLDRVDAVAQEMNKAGDRLGRRYRRVEKAMAEMDEKALEPNAKVDRAMDELAAEARKSFERIAQAKRPKRFWIF